jgi:hypothetical protein
MQNFYRHEVLYEKEAKMKLALRKLFIGLEKYFQRILYLAVLKHSFSRHINQ